MKFYKVNIFSALILSMTFLSEPGFSKKKIKTVGVGQFSSVPMP